MMRGIEKNINGIRS